MPLTEIPFPPPMRIQERPGSGKLSCTKAGLVGTRIYEIPWPQRYDFLRTLLGSPNLNLLPEQFDADLEAPLFCVEAQLDGEESDGADANGKIKYKRGIIQAKYTPQDFNEHLSLNGQILTQKGSGFSWAGTTYDAPFPVKPDPLTIDVGKLVPLGEYTFERHQVLVPDFYTIIGLIGSVNKAGILGFPPEGLLFVGCDANRTWMPSGIRVWDMKFNFLTNFGQGGWLQQYRVEKARYEYIKTIALGPDPVGGVLNHQPLYPRRDFDPILKPEF